MSENVFKLQAECYYLSIKEDIEKELDDPSCCYGLLSLIGRLKDKDLYCKYRKFILDNFQYFKSNFFRFMRETNIEKNILKDDNDSIAVDIEDAKEATHMFAEIYLEFGGVPRNAIKILFGR